MKSITIHIGREAILKDVRMMTQYAGDRAGDENYEKLGLTADSDEVIVPAYRKAAADVMNLLSEHAVKADRAGEDGIELSLPDNYNDVSTDTLERNISNAIVQYCLSEWYKIAGDARADVCAANYTQSMADAIACLSRRMRPHRVKEPVVLPVSEITYE